MKESQSHTNNLLMEVDVLSNRLRNIKQSFKTTENKALKERLFSETKNIFKRVKEIYKIAELLNKKNNEKMNFSNLLFEITKRTLDATNKFTKGKVISVLEGGYDLNALAESAFNHVKALSETE